MRALRLQALWILTFSLLAAADPFLGTWKLDTDKSKFTVGDPSFMFVTMRIESSGAGLKSTASAADGQGFASDFTFNCSLDGTPCSVTSSLPQQGASAIDTVSFKRVDDRTIVATGTKNGRLVYTDQRVVSPDGMSITVSRKGTTPQGKKYESTIVMVRVK